MEYRRFGNSSLSVSALGFGLWPIGGTTTHGYGTVDDNDAIGAIRHALDLGITLFDTAPAYGNGRGEQILAKALGSRRKDTIIVTKCGVPWSEEQKRWLRDSSYESITASVETSLRALHTDYIDLLLIHYPDPETPFEISMRALADLIQSGKVRYVGVSNYSVEQLDGCLAHGSLAAQQIGYHMFDRRPEARMLPFCQEHGIGVMAYGTLAHGLLTGAFSRDTRFAPNDWRARGDLFGQPLLTPDNLATNVTVVERLKAFAESRGRPITQLAVAWVLRQPAVTTALTGARRPSEIEENAGGVGWILNEEDIEAIEGIMEDAAGMQRSS